MSKIFLSYRRQDSAGVAGRIEDRLRAHFGDDAIFMDIASIPFGLDFREHISSAVDPCGVLLAVIGPKGAGEAGAPRRIEDPGDFVRIEIESALERKLPVLPILIERARRSGEANRPPSLARLAYRNAIPPAVRGPPRGFPSATTRMRWARTHGIRTSRAVRRTRSGRSSRTPFGRPAGIH